MKNKMNKLTLGVALAAAATAYAGGVHAGAFQLNEQSVSTQGTSFAGRASNANDASTVFGNPAGMSFLDRAQITGGVTYLDVNTDIDVASANDALGRPVSGGDDGDMVPGAAVPSFYYVQPMNDRVALGFGVYAPFGVITDYGSDFRGRYFANYSEVEVVTAQPTISYRINDKWAIGAGVTYNSIKGELTSNTLDVGAGDGKVKIKGDDAAWGYNVGVIFQPVESTRLGLSYRSKVDYSLDGEAKYNNVFTGTGFANTEQDASLDMTLPESIDFSVTHKLDDRWTLMAGVTWVHWSRFDEIAVEVDNMSDIVEEQGYEDSWQYAVGLSYQLNPQWVLRTGMAFDDSPAVDEHRSARIPSGDRTIFSLGAGWTPMPELTIDMAYTYLWEETATVSLSEPNRGTYEADYENEAHGFGLGATYRF